MPTAQMIEAAREHLKAGGDTGHLTTSNAVRETLRELGHLDAGRGLAAGELEAFLERSLPENGPVITAAKAQAEEIGWARFGALVFDGEREFKAHEEACRRESSEAAARAK